MKTNPFTSDQAAALQALSAIWETDKVVLIGAAALGCYIDMRWRKTNDLDLSLSVSMEEYPGGLDRAPGWTRHPTKEHEWTSPQGVRVDILPGGKDLVDAGGFVWPESGFRMSLTGFRLVFEQAKRFRVNDELTIQVAPIPVVALLKMTSYLDRPLERARDLEDLAYLLDGYLAADDERRYSTEIIERDLSFEDTNAFLLGMDISSMVNSAEMHIVTAFLTRLKAADGSMAARMLRYAPLSWQGEPETLIKRVLAFEQGVDEARQGSSR